MIHGTFLVFYVFIVLVFFFFFCSSSLPLVELFLHWMFVLVFFSCFTPLSLFRRGLEVGGSLFICGDVGRSWEGGEGQRLAASGREEKKKQKLTWAERGGKKRRVMLGFGVFLRGQWMDEYSNFLRVDAVRVDGKLACRRYRIDGKRRKRVGNRVLTWHYVVELDGFVFCTSVCS